MEQIEKIEKQNITKKELHDKILSLNRWNPSDLKKHQLKFLNERMSELENLGDYGVKIEELRLSIEHRYENMMNDVEKRLRDIKDHFIRIFDETIGEFSNTLLFHKTQNLGNLKDLEKDLNSIKTKEKKRPPKGIVFDLYTDESLDNLFSFMNNFKEEFFGLILSKCLLKNTEEMKDVVQKFKTQYLNNLIQGPKLFPSELFADFKKDVTRKNIPPSRNYGKYITAVAPPGDFISDFCKGTASISPGFDSKLKSPILIPINKSLFVAASRNQFIIYLDTYSERDTKSSFYKEAYRQASNSANRFLQVASGSLPTSDNDIHCGCFIKFDSSREYLFLGGDRNVVIS